MVILKHADSQNIFCLVVSSILVMSWAQQRDTAAFDDKAFGYNLIVFMVLQCVGYFLQTAYTLNIWKGFTTKPFSGAYNITSLMISQQWPRKYIRIFNERPYATMHARGIVQVSFCDIYFI